MRMLFDDIKKTLKLFNKCWYKKFLTILVLPFIIPFYWILNVDKVNKYAPIINIVILWIIFLIALLN